MALKRIFGCVIKVWIDAILKKVGGMLVWR
jgi:hypothetical protein